MKAQGSLEYLYLIGGVVVVAVIVIGITFTLSNESGKQAEAGKDAGFGFIGGETDKLKKELLVNCGNGLDLIDEGEECDGTNLNGRYCTTEGFSGGTLKCSEVCEFDTSSCVP